MKIADIYKAMENQNTVLVKIGDEIKSCLVTDLSSDNYFYVEEAVSRKFHRVHQRSIKFEGYFHLDAKYFFEKCKQSKYYKAN